MTDQEINSLIDQKIKAASQEAQYGVARVPAHTHNNIDSPNLNQHSVVGFASLNGTPAGTNQVAGVANQGNLDGQALAQGNTTVSSVAVPFSGGGNQFTANIYTYPLPIIYGFGTTTALTLTGSPVAGNVSATLTGNWIGTTGTYAVQFNNGEIRSAKLTNGTTAVTWKTALLYNTGGTSLVEIGNARFHGGLAPNGTALIFRNDDDGVLQLWVRTEPGLFVETWASVTLTLSIAD